MQSKRIYVIYDCTCTNYQQRKAVDLEAFLTYFYLEFSKQMYKLVKRMDP